MRRRKFITLIGGAAAWPLAVAAKQPDSLRHIGLLMGWSVSNSEFRGFAATFVGELARLGWIDGRNARIEERWTDADSKRASAFANGTHRIARLYSPRLRQRRQPCTAERPPSPSCLQSSSTRCVRVSSPVCRAPAATSRGSDTPAHLWRQVAKIYSRRSCLASNAPRSCLIPTRRPTAETFS
jgi:hypothetical protein